MSDSSLSRLARIAGALALVGVALSSAAATAGNYYGIARPYYYSNILYIDVSAMNRTTLPACATRTTVRLTADQSSAEFKQEYALLLLHWSTGRAVNLTGTGTCTAEGDEYVLTIMPQ